MVFAAPSRGMKTLLVFAMTALSLACPTPDVDGLAQDLIRLLGSDEPAERDRAEQELGEMGRQSIAALAEAAGSDDPEVAARARRALRVAHVRAILPPRVLWTFHGGEGVQKGELTIAFENGVAVFRTPMSIFRPSGSRISFTEENAGNCDLTITCLREPWSVVDSFEVVNRVTGTVVWAGTNYGEEGVEITPGPQYGCDGDPVSFLALLFELPDLPQVPGKSVLTRTLLLPMTSNSGSERVIVCEDQDAAPDRNDVPGATRWRMLVGETDKCEMMFWVKGGRVVRWWFVGYVTDLEYPQ